jgi:hypothetical protein
VYATNELDDSKLLSGVAPASPDNALPDEDVGADEKFNNTLYAFDVTEL